GAILSSPSAKLIRETAIIENKGFSDQSCSPLDLVSCPETLHHRAIGWIGTPLDHLPAVSFREIVNSDVRNQIVEFSRTHFGCSTAHEIVGHDQVIIFPEYKVGFGDRHPDVEASRFLEDIVLRQENVLIGQSSGDIFCSRPIIHFNNYDFV